MSATSCILFALFFMLLLILVIGGALHMSGKADEEIQHLQDKEESNARD